MAFTTSDTFFIYVRVSLYDLIRGSCAARAINTNGDYFSVILLDEAEHPTPEIGTQAHTDWEILKETWALNNGFLDENGDVITIYVTV